MDKTPAKKSAPVAETTTEKPARVIAPASIYLEKSVTKNLGKFNSAKVTVGITLPVDYTDAMLAKVQEAIDVAVDIVDERIADEVSVLEEVND